MPLLSPAELKFLRENKTLDYKEISPNARYVYMNKIQHKITKACAEVKELLNIFVFGDINSVQTSLTHDLLNGIGGLLKTFIPEDEHARVIKAMLHEFAKKSKLEWKDANLTPEDIIASNL